MKLNLTELIEKLNSQSEIKVSYTSHVKLLKKNRTTKQKLSDEYPSLNNLIKTSTYTCGINKSLAVLIEENKRDEPKPIVESVEPKKERTPWYSHVSDCILKHNTKDTHYLYVQLIDREDDYEAVLDDLEEAFVVEDELSNLIPNYCPLETKSDVLMESHWTKKAIDMKQLILENVNWVEIDGERFEIEN